MPTDAEKTLEAAEYLKGISNIIRKAEDENFFLRVSLEQELEDLGIFGRAINSANSLWEALQTAATAFKYFQSNSELVIRTYHGRCRVWYFTTLNPNDAKQDIQYTMGLLAKIVLLARAQIDPEITITYPGGASTHFNNLACEVSVRDSSQGHISFHEDLLKAKMRQSDSVRAGVLMRYLNGRSLVQMPELQKSEMVAGLVKASFGVAPWSLADTAQVLGIGERSLQIQLRDEGTVFREIAKTERHKEARRLLTHGISIENTADAIGFEHRQSFSEAFANWEGCSPSVYAKKKN
ncbi:helix-turn-helix domain-containing protein [Shimia sp.]|uniref:AraC family transcriptional regulator n=1 Tax=Shimia sp. TaxID=1954381 RepID=UPI003299CBE0